MRKLDQDVFWWGLALVLGLVLAVLVFWCGPSIHGFFLPVDGGR